MTTSVLEQTRQYHEDIEIGEKKASRLLSERAKRKQKFYPVYDRAILETLLQIQDSTRKLLELYADKNEIRREEIQILGGVKKFSRGGTTELGSGDSSDEGKTVWLNFYDQLKVLKDSQKGSENEGSYESFFDNTKDIALLAAEVLERCNVEQIFNTNESFGKRVDLSQSFLAYTNLTKLRKHRENEFYRAAWSRSFKKLQISKKDHSAEESDREKKADEFIKEQKISDAAKEQIAFDTKSLQFQEIDYITYLRFFDNFRSIPRYCKYREPQYLVYLSDLLNYLQNFLIRVNPLAHHPRIKSHIELDFKTQWERKAILGWEKPTHTEPFYSLPTDRLFSSEGTFKSHVNGKTYKKMLQILQASPLEEQQKRIKAAEEHDEIIAKTEFMIQRYKDIVGYPIQRTVEHLQKKQSRTLRELELEEEESDDENHGKVMTIRKEPAVQEMQSDDDDSDGEKPVYNPLNLPLGWDGKPIPFWLYKLHGLGVEFKCEICGNYSYWGRRAFERHFQEWRHAFGMRCLKIPNTVHFKEITKIEDAVLLYEKLKNEAESQTFKADHDVECEDSEGNVMSARAYQDLRRQGLL